MAVYILCPGCQLGNHDEHVRHWGKRPEGIIDGEFCPCEGNCSEIELPDDIRRMLSRWGDTSAADHRVDGSGEQYVFTPAELDERDAVIRQRVLDNDIYQARCRCGKMMLEPSEGCTWHEARAEKAQKTRHEQGSFEL